MAALMDCMGGALPAPLWLDDDAYCERLLAAGHTAWLDSAAYVAFRRKAQGLLNPDISALPVGRVMQAWVAAQPPLRAAMAAKQRAIAPARALLADEGLRAHLTEVVSGLRAALAGAPLVMAMPSPRALVIEAWRLAFGAAAEVSVGGDESDACAVYVAEFLRTFGACGVDGLLLEELAGAAPIDAAELAWYQPVINTAAHYRWDLGVRWPDAAQFTGPATPMQFVIAPREIAGACYGQILPAAFWDGAEPEADAAARFRFATVPVDAVPERVLARLAALRQR